MKGWLVRGRSTENQNRCGKLLPFTYGKSHPRPPCSPSFNSTRTTHLRGAPADHVIWLSPQRRQQPHLVADPAQPPQPVPRPRDAADLHLADLAAVAHVDAALRPVARHHVVLARLDDSVAGEGDLGGGGGWGGGDEQQQRRGGEGGWWGVD